MKSTLRLGSALILGATLISGISVSAFAQAGSDPSSTSNSTTDAPVNGATGSVTRTPANANTVRTQATPTQAHVGATSAKANAKIKKAQMLSRKGKTIAVKPHSAAARENGPTVNPNAVISGVSGGGVAAPPPSGNTTTTNSGAAGTGATGTSTSP